MVVVHGAGTLLRGLVSHTLGTCHPQPHAGAWTESTLASKFTLASRLVRQRGFRAGEELAHAGERSPRQLDRSLRPAWPRRSRSRIADSLHLLAYGKRHI